MNSNNNDRINEEILLIVNSIINCYPTKVNPDLFFDKYEKRSFFFKNNIEQIALFKVFEQLIKNSIDQRELYIYENKSKFLNHSIKKTFGEIGRDLNLSGERVRQLLNITEKRIKTRLKKYINQNGVIIRNTVYFQKNWSNLIVLNNDVINNINELEKTNFSVELIEYIFCLIYSKHILITNNPNLKNKYFINKKIYAADIFLKRFFKYFFNKNIRNESIGISNSTIISICETVINEELNN